MKLIINLDRTALEPKDLNIFALDVAARLHAFGINRSDITIDLKDEVNAN